MRRPEVSFSIEVDRNGKPTVSINPGLAETKVNQRDLIELAFAYCKEVVAVSGMRVVLMMDEFQHFAEYSSVPALKGILDIFRHFIDEKGEGIVVLVSGSRIHFLISILAGGRSPPFGRFTLVEVGELEERYAVELYCRARGGQVLREAQEAYRLVGGNPFYVLSLAENRRGKETVKEAYMRLLAEPTGPLNLHARYVIANDLGSHMRSRQSRFLMTLRALGEDPVSL